MNKEEIERVQLYRGDRVEDEWKPSLTEEKPYVDWFYYWEFRQALAGGDLTHLRPLQPNSSVNMKVVYQHERLRGYYYSAFVRFAVMLEQLQLLKDMFEPSNIIDAINPAKPALWEIISRFEGFYHFLGSVLDMLGGVGNILYSFEGDEDSFKNFSNKLGDSEIKTELEVQIEALSPGIERIKAYRDHIVHRPAFAQWQIIRRHENRQVGVTKDVLIEGDYSLGRAQGMKMWRKVLRNMVEGRTPSVSIIDLGRDHKGQIEELGNLLFQSFLGRLPQYLDDNQIRIISDRTSEVADLKNPPDDAEFIFYLCRTCEKRNPPLAIWMQRLSEPIDRCINLVRSDDPPFNVIRCDNPDILPLFYVTNAK